jgi:hypothetical protein
MAAADREVYICHLSKAVRVPPGERVLTRVRRISYPIVLPEILLLIIRGS